ncbi:MAG: hypothetical protein AB8F78_10790 [Saprospiraceae bacterium]
MKKTNSFRALLGFLASDSGYSKWYQTIIWWETYRILYNLLMVVIGIGSIAIASIQVPFLYLLIAAGLNFGYTFLAILELLYKKDMLEEGNLKSLRKKHFISYFALSSIVVISFSVLLLSITRAAQ